MPETTGVRAPVTRDEWHAYYELRWRILREPWAQPRGSERDEFETVAEHRMICTMDGSVLAVGRLHYPEPCVGQVRFMAVTQACRERGLGKQLLEALEETASARHCRVVVLHARELLVPFYQKCGYAIVAKSHILYNEIQHFEMRKDLTA